MRNHATLSPSGADRWLECPMSATATVDAPYTTSVHAEVGTVTHLVGELALKYNKTVSELFSGLLYNAEQYINYVREYETSTSESLYEAKVKIFKGCWGTCDALVYDKGHLHVIDLKSGKVPVKAKGNAQLMLYALGAMKLFPDTKKVTLHIAQPRAKDNMWDISVGELRLFQKFAKKSGKKALDAENLEANPSNSRCWYCPAKDKCEAYQHDGKQSPFKKVK